MGSVLKQSPLVGHASAHRPRLKSDMRALYILLSGSPLDAAISQVPETLLPAGLESLFSHNEWHSLNICNAFRLMSVCSLSPGIVSQPALFFCLTVTAF